MRPIRQWDRSPLPARAIEWDHSQMPKVADTPLARRIDARMKALGIGQKHLALRAGLNETYVRDILAGKSRNPLAAKLAQLATVLECDVAELLALAGTPQSGQLVADPAELLLLTTWRQLPQQEREGVLDFIHFRLSQLGGSRDGSIGKAV
jgi:transcriptional regulator with XRE-family HTH domain